MKYSRVIIKKIAGLEGNSPRIRYLAISIAGIDLMYASCLCLMPRTYWIHSMVRRIRLSTLGQGVSWTPARGAQIDCGATINMSCSKTITGSPDCTGASKFIVKTPWGLLVGFSKLAGYQHDFCAFRWERREERTLILLTHLNQGVHITANQRCPNVSISAQPSR